MLQATASDPNSTVAGIKTRTAFLHLSMGFYRMHSICPSFHAHNTEVLTSCCKTNMLALGVMVRLASFSSTAVMSASPCAGSRRAQQLNKPLRDPDSREEMILPQDTLWQTHKHKCAHTHTLGKVKQVGLKNLHPQSFRRSLYTHTKTHIPSSLGLLCSFVHSRGILFYVQTLR